MSCSRFDSFTASRSVFQGVSGYIVNQFINGVLICSQFISDDDFPFYVLYLDSEGYGIDFIDDLEVI